MPQYDYLVVGAGLFGSVFARRMTDAGRSCLVIDKRDHIGGNCFTRNRRGIDEHRYGPHIFHTKSRRIWDFVRRYAEFHPYRHKVKARCGRRTFSFPINLMTLHQLWGVNTPQEAAAELQRQCIPIAQPADFEQWALARVGPELYELFIRGYTRKQWGKDPRELPASILKRLPIRFNFNDDYFADPYQGIPIGGYTAIFEKLLHGVDVRLDTDYFARRRELERSAEKIVYTGMIDRFFDYSLGQLEWRSLRFETEDLPMEDYQGGAIVNYCDAHIPFTRITEFKHFLPPADESRGHTIITREFPQAWTPQAEPYYPINTKANDALLAEYRLLKPRNVIFGGRLGDYRYYDMDQVIGSALARAGAELGIPEAVEDRPAQTPHIRRPAAPAWPSAVLPRTITQGEPPMDQIADRQTESAHQLTRDSGDFPANGCFTLSTPQGRRLAGNVIMHANGRIYSDSAELNTRGWHRLNTRPGALLCAGIVWNRAAEGLVTSDFRSLSNRRIRPQMLRQGRLPNRPEGHWRGTVHLTPQRPLPPRSEFEIVVAKYREDTAWTQAVAANAAVYCKDTGCGDHCPYSPLPNIGREYGTYLHHIVNRYDTLAERTLFVQGDPFFHRLPALDQFAFSGEDFLSLANMHHTMAQTVNWGWPGQTVDGRIKQAFLQLLERDADFPRFSFTWGAQFAVSRRLIHSHPKSYYRKLHEIATLPQLTLCGTQFDNLHLGFMFEFFWEKIFRPNAFTEPETRGRATNAAAGAAIAGV